MNYHRCLTSPRKAGMALIITLSALMLLSVLVLAFFSRAQCNRQISSSSTNIISAKSAAHSALDIVVGELRGEITDTTRSTVTSSNGVVLYQPSNSAYLLPAQLGVASGTGPLVKVSAANTAIRPNGTIQASPYSISTPNLKGAGISTGRWFTSTSSPKLGSQPGLPCWLFLTRGNGVKTPASVDAARNHTGDDYVIGRFAFTVYDIGQLLDANLAGYPTLAASDAETKSSCAYADLTALGLSAANVADFISWRNASTGSSADTFREWAAGLPAASGTVTPALASAWSGHYSIVNGDNVFFSRHDLLNHPSLASYAGSLTHFSRALNAPTYSPATVTTNNPNLPNIRFTANTTGTHYKDDGTTETYTVQKGDFLLQRRFSLAKLAWLTHTGPLGGISDAAIQACFGLSWDNKNYNWIYIGDGTTAQTSIKSLGDIAKANREPNFFELLQAGIVEGSLGKSGGTGGKYGIASVSGLEAKTAYQVIRIGANLIDQYDSDSYPTAISFNGFQFFGIEDLPYLNKILFKNRGQQGPKSSNYLPPFTSYFIYELWNPHQAATTSTTGRPTHFRVRINEDATYSAVMRSPTTGTQSVPSDAPLVLSGVGGDPLEFDADTLGSDAKNSYREPRLIRTGDSSTLRSELTDSSYGACNAIMLPTVTSSTLTNIMWINNSLNNAVFLIDYQDDNGWHPYTSFAGCEEAGGVSGITYAPSYGVSTTDGVTACYANLSDPRTFRLNAHDSITGTNAGDHSLHPDDKTYLMDNHAPPNFILSTLTGVYPPYYLSLLAANNPAAADPNGLSYSYADNDGTTRPGDAWYGVNPYAQADSSARPVILNRPLRSVGELGYVFRDLPWKTLDLFTDQSADRGLLDLFSLTDEPLRSAGRLSLNTRQTATVQSLFSGVPSISDASTLASSFINYSTSGAMDNPGSLAAFIYSGPSGVTSQIKTEREAPVRALASACQSRTWNLLIDVIAQTGRYTTRSSTLDDFLVEGEARYWLSIAIDRYTGKIIDQQLENANEH